MDQKEGKGEKSGQWSQAPTCSPRKLNLIIFTDV